MVRSLVVDLALGLALALTACGEPAAPPPPPLPEVGLPDDLEPLLFGSTDNCREDLDCASGSCVFGLCSGMLTVDEPWRAERVATTLRARVAAQPELGPRLVDTLAEIATREEAGLPFRGRAAHALGLLGGEPARAALTRLLPGAPGRVGEVVALELAHLGDASPPVLEIVLELARGEDLPASLEALRALGGARSPDALIALLEHLSPEIDLELQRAAIAGLARQGDARAVRPLARHLTTGPEALADDVAAALRALTGAALGPDALAWDAQLQRSPPPEPPAYTPRVHRSEDDLDIPTP